MDRLTFSRREQAGDNQPPGLLGWALLLLLVLGGCLMAPSCMGYGWQGEGLTPRAPFEADNAPIEPVFYEPLPSFESRSR